MHISTIRTVAAIGTFAAFIPGAIPAGIALASVGTYLVVRRREGHVNLDLVRPSTLARVVEDGVIGAGSKIGRTVKRFTSGVKIEFRARQIDQLQRAVQVEAKTLREMSPADRKKLAKTEAQIFARAEELRAKRETRSSSSSGRSATL